MSKTWKRQRETSSLCFLINHGNLRIYKKMKCKPWSPTSMNGHGVKNMHWYMSSLSDTARFIGTYILTDMDALAFTQVTQASYCNNRHHWRTTGNRHRCAGQVRITRVHLPRVRTPVYISRWPNVCRWGKRGNKPVRHVLMHCPLVAFNFLIVFKRKEKRKMVSKWYIWH